MESKICTKCGGDKPLDEFSFKRKDKGTKRADCKSCNRLIIQTHYQNNRENYLSSNGKRRAVKRQMFRDYLADKCCQDCGNLDSRVLEFDHVKGNKFSNVSTMINRNFSWDNILIEIAKCEIVCANCHRIRTSITQGWVK